MLVPQSSPTGHSSSLNNMSYTYDDCAPASAIDAAFASATLLLSPCFPFYNSGPLVKVHPNAAHRLRAHSRSTWRISVPSPLFSQLPIACHPSSFVERLLLRPRGTCCSCSKTPLAGTLQSARPLNCGTGRIKNGLEHT
jgi:hypothetical protein